MNILDECRICLLGQNWKFANNSMNMSSGSCLNTGMRLPYSLSISLLLQMLSFNNFANIIHKTCFTLSKVGGVGGGGGGVALNPLKNYQKKIVKREENSGPERSPSRSFVLVGAVSAFNLALLRAYLSPWTFYTFPSK